MHKIFQWQSKKPNKNVNEKYSETKYTFQKYTFSTQYLNFNKLSKKKNIYFSIGNVKKN